MAQDAARDGLSGAEYPTAVSAASGRSKQEALQGRQLPFARIGREPEPSRLTILVPAAPTKRRPPQPRVGIQRNPSDCSGLAIFLVDSTAASRFV